MDMTYFEYTRKEILPLLPKGCARVLEVGCGAGNTLAWLKTLKKCEWIGGVELSASAAALARKKLDTVYEGNIEDLELPSELNGLDIILCLDVLEHLKDPWTVVARLSKLLKRNGSLIVSLPNVRNHSVVFPLLFRDKWVYKKEGIMDKGHLRFFVRDTAIDLVESAGLKVDMITATGLGRSRKSKMLNSFLPSLITSLFVKQYLIRATNIK